jgi:hypothetical protein
MHIGNQMREDIKKLIPEHLWDKTHKKKKTNKSLRRHIRRLSERKGISYEMGILHFYKVGSLKELDKNLVYSLFKR